MTTRTLVCCDRCGVTIEPAKRSTIPHTKVQVTTFDREYLNTPMDLCERCTQSLKMWLRNLPNAEVKYRQYVDEPLEDGTFADVVRRISEGANIESFYRRAWPDHNALGWAWRDGEGTYLIYFVNEYIEERLSLDDLTATDWMETWDEPKADGGDEGDEEGDE